MMDTQRDHGFAPHARVAQDQEDRHVTRPAALLRGFDQGIHDRRSGNLSRRLAVVRWPFQLRARTVRRYAFNDVERCLAVRAARVSVTWSRCVWPTTTVTSSGDEDGLPA